MSIASLSVNFFTSVRIPAAFVSGSSLAATFSLIGKRDHDPDNNTLEQSILVAHNFLALSAFLLSLNVVITSSATANMLLLSRGTEDEINPDDDDAGTRLTVYQYLKENYGYEFTLVRWSFFMSLFAFLGCFGLRVLLEFQLLERKRRRAAIAVSLMVAALFFDLMSFVNERIYSWPNLGMMTIDLFFMYVKRVSSLRPAELLSMVCSIVGILTMLWMFYDYCCGLSSTRKEKTS